MLYLSCMNEEGTSWSAGPLGEVRGSAYGGHCVKYFPPFKMTMLAHVLKCWRAGESFPFTTQSHAKKKKHLEYQGQQKKSVGLPLHYADICENFMLPCRFIPCRFHADSPKG